MYHAQMDTPLDSDLLRTFVAIADSGSVTRAATIVRRTQSAVSMQLKRLEDIVGQALFVREARGVTLTRPGERLLAHARRVLRLLDQAARDLQAAPVAGAVRVGIPEEYGATLLPDILARFAVGHPDIEVTVTCAESLTLADALAAEPDEPHALDLAALVIDSGQSEGEVLSHDPTVWVTSSRHLAHEQDPLPVAMYHQGCWWRDWALKSLADRGIRYRIAYTSAGVASLQAAVSTGLAVAVLGRSTMPAGSRVLTAAEGFTELPGSSVVLRSRAGPSQPASEAMAGAIREAFAAL